MVKILVKPGLLLKELTSEDATSLFSVIDSNRTYLREWLPWVDTTLSVEDSLGFINFAQTQKELGKMLVLGVWSEDQLVGTVSLVDIREDEHSAEIGYWIAESEQGKGIVTASCKKLIRYAFERCGDIQTIGVRCVTENTRSLAVLTRLNLSCEAVVEEQWSQSAFAVVPVTKGTLNKEAWLSAQQSRAVSPFVIWTRDEMSSPNSAVDSSLALQASQF